jgi:hypothetical protein
MQLPGRLRSTTLGDILGTLHRGLCTGTLELAEDRGRIHRVHLVGGLVVAVELDSAGPTLGEVLRSEGLAEDEVIRRSLLRALASQRLHGEVLVGEFRVSPAVVGAGLRRQLAARLALLEEVKDARVCFRVTVKRPREALEGSSAAGPTDFLHGRRRARERATTGASNPRPAAASEGQGPGRGRPTPWQALGLPPGAASADIKKAYRRLARAVHPDLHPDATDGERRVLSARFSVLTEAYRALTELEEQPAHG